MIYSYQISFKNFVMALTLFQFLKPIILLFQLLFPVIIFLTHQIFKNHQIYCLNKLSRKEIYSILIESSDSKPSSQWYYKNVF